MILVEKHIINKQHEQWEECDRLCFLAKNLYNQTLYRIRQHYFETKKCKKITELDKEMILENQVDYRAISARSSLMILRLVDQNMRSFFAANRRYQKDKKGFLGKPKVPKYKDKEKGRCVISFDYVQVKVKDNYIKFPKKENLRPLKTKVLPEQFKQVRIIPTASSYVIEVVYEKKEVTYDLDKKLYLSIDLGINNLCSITSNKPGLKPILINGRPLKSINQYFNKELAKAQSFLSNQKIKTSNRIKKLLLKRSCRVTNFLHNTSRIIVDFCLTNKIGNIVIGKNKGWKQEVNLGKVNNQKFVQIPFETLIQQIKYKSELVGIKVTITEESYTSKCSSLDLEDICKHEEYIGKRVKRGLFRTGSGKFVNADLNGSFNILRKVIGNDFINTLDMATAVQPLLVTPIKNTLNFKKHDIKV